MLDAHLPGGFSPAPYLYSTNSCVKLCIDPTLEAITGGCGFNDGDSLHNETP